MTTRTQNTIKDMQRRFELNTDRTNDDGQWLRGPLMRFADDDPNNGGTPMAADRAETAAEKADIVKLPDHAKSTPGTKKYIIRPGREHWYITQGERVQGQSGDAVYLHPSAYEAFKDKFYDPEETAPDAPLFEQAGVILPPNKAETAAALTASVEPLVAPVAPVAPDVTPAK